MAKKANTETAEERPAEATEQTTEERPAEATEQTAAPDQRGRIQVAVDNFVGRRATADDYRVLTDRAVMYHATMGQAMDIIEALQQRLDEASVDVMWAAAVTLCTRVKQSPSFGKRSRSGSGRRTFRGPNRWSHQETDEARADEPELSLY